MVVLQSMTTDSFSTIYKYVLVDRASMNGILCVSVEGVKGSPPINSTTRTPWQRQPPECNHGMYKISRDRDIPSLTFPSPLDDQIDRLDGMQ